MTAVTTYEAGEMIMDVLPAGAAVALVGCAAWVAVQSRRSSTVRLFGRTLRYPRLWAVGAACMGFYVLVGLGNLVDVAPSGWRAPGRWTGAVLLLAGLALMVTYGVLEHRARRRIGRDQHVRP